MLAGEQVDELPARQTRVIASWWALSSRARCTASTPRPRPRRPAGPGRRRSAPAPDSAIRSWSISHSCFISSQSAFAPSRSPASIASIARVHRGAGELRELVVGETNARPCSLPRSLVTTLRRILTEPEKLRDELGRRGSRITSARVCAPSRTLEPAGQAAPRGSFGRSTSWPATSAAPAFSAATPRAWATRRGAGASGRCCVPRTTAGFPCPSLCGSSTRTRGAGFVMGAARGGGDRAARLLREDRLRTGARELLNRPARRRRRADPRKYPWRSCPPSRRPEGPPALAAIAALEAELDRIGEAAPGA